MTRADTEILTVDDLAELFSCDKETAAARLTRGDLPGVKVGRRWVIPRQALFERLNEMAHEQAALRRSAFEPPTKDSKEMMKLDNVSIKPTTSHILPSTERIINGRRRRIPPDLSIFLEGDRFK